MGVGKKPKKNSCKGNAKKKNSCKEKGKEKKFMKKEGPIVTFSERLSFFRKARVSEINNILEPCPALAMKSRVSSLLT